MAEWYKGKRFSTPEEEGLPPLTEQEIADADAAFEEFDRLRAAVPPEQRFPLRDHFVEDDRLGAEAQAAYLAEVEERKKRGEHQD
ncbi:hypothetical protein ABIA39_000140 [Nocardia sp. GAS34]|uniref:hypothetical protein n=1 Tax=unclassified Nocardia TaxID=2637762 RepID=UPI003D19FD6C